MVGADVSRFVRRQFERGAPDFVWGHFMDPHSPYHPETSIGEVPDLSPEELDALTERVHGQDATALTGPEQEQVRQLYDGNVRYMAAHLGELLDWLADRHWYDQSMVVVTADHGELLGEHGRLAHPWDAEPYDELVDVPLFVKFPRGARSGETITHLTSHADCYRTIREYFGDKAGPEEGTTLLDEGPREIASASNTALRLTTRNGTVVRTRNGECRVDGEIPEEALVRLRNREIPACSNLSGRKPGVADSEREQQLEALGYR